MSLSVKHIFVIIPFWGLFSCSESGPNTMNDIVEQDQSYINSLDEVKNIFYMIPSPMETAILVKKSGAEYDYRLLNAPNNVSKYDTKYKKAVNLGVYSADLSYATLYDQIQDIRFYITSSKSLAEDLGVMKAFDQNMIDRVEYNLEDKDSMMSIVSDIYWIADAHLKETDNVVVSSLMLYGGWIEAFYLAANLYSVDIDNTELRMRITEQKHSLDNLLSLLTKTAVIDEQINDCIDHLKQLQELFNSFHLEEESPVLLDEKENGINVIGGKSEITMTPKQFESLFNLVKEIRSKNIS